MKAITFNLLAWIMLPIMDGFAKYLSADLPVLQITWARYFFTVVFTFPVWFLISSIGFVILSTIQYKNTGKSVNTIFLSVMALIFFASYLILLTK